MNRSQVIILTIALLMVAGMYQLPRAVVRKKEDKTASKKPTTTEKVEQHQAKLSPAQRQKLNSWKKALQKEEAIEKKRIFADSIAFLYRSVNKIDSAATAYEEAIGKSKEPKDLFLIGDTWFEAYTLALDAERGNRYGEQARKWYAEILAKDSKAYKAKVNTAITYATTSEPMKAAFSLRDVLAEDPRNEMALYALGSLSIQSGQYDKAVGRFETLLQINPQHLEAKLGLAQSLWSQKKPDKARAKQILTELTQLKVDSLAVYKQLAQETLDKWKNE